jgi:hypothetical protein
VEDQQCLGGAHAGNLLIQRCLKDVDLGRGEKSQWDWKLIGRQSAIRRKHDDS